MCDVGAVHHNALLAGPAARCIEMRPISTWQVSSVSVDACINFEYAVSKCSKIRISTNQNFQQNTRCGQCAVDCLSTCVSKVLYES